MIKKILLIAQFIAFSICIYYLSSIPKPLQFLEGFNIWDKALHGFGFFCYSISTLIAFKEIFKNKSKNFVILSVIIFFAIFAASDEIHQYFVPGRSCDILDYAADLVGGIFGIFIIGNLFIFRKK